MEEKRKGTPKISEFTATFIVETIGEDKNIAVITVRKTDDLNELLKKVEVIYVVKGDKWESEFKDQLVAGSTVTATIVDVKGHLAIAKIGSSDVCSKGARGKLPKFVQQYNSAKARVQNEKIAAAKKAENDAKFKDIFGYRPLVEPAVTQEDQKRHYIDICTLNKSKIGTSGWVRGRVHTTRPVSSSLIFFTLRHHLSTVQAVIKDHAELVKFAKTNATKESIVDIYITVIDVEKPVDSVSQSDIEINIQKFFMISQAVSILPLELEVAARPDSVVADRIREIKEHEAKIKVLEQALAEGGDKEKVQAELNELLEKSKTLKPYSTVGADIKLDNRVLDLRTPANHAIFRIQSGVCKFFRDILTSKGFIEIHSPKLISAASEGGADVFKLEYFEKYGIPYAYLAQSPQLYKQMAVAGDFDRVFEIGPVFRREDSNTHRHMTEFTGLDLEMAFKQHYHEVLDVLDELFVGLFQGLETHFAQELATVGQQYPFEPLKFLPKSLRLVWPEAIAKLQAELAKPVEKTIDPVLVAEILADLAKDGKTNVGDLDDLSTKAEKLLGCIVKVEYNTDFYILDKFPAHIRPFYTMWDAEDERFANAYDLFLRGEEICSGGQRIHNPQLLKERALQRGVDLKTVQAYIECFGFGAEPHGGGGIGLERVVMLYLGIGNIRKTALFPRDPKRITP